MVKYYYKKQQSKLRQFKKPLGIGLVLCGLLVLIYFFMPVLLWHVYFSKALATGSIEVPIPKSLVINNSPSLQGLFAQGVANFTTDFKDARNWYPTLPSSVNKNSVPFYSLGISKLGIENAEVSTVDYDLSKHLVQYAGTALPGDKGTAVIFGHSTLPRLFDKNNYKTIFANLHTLKAGDKITIRIKDVSYTYEIYSILVTDPDDTSMFDQQYDASYIALVTCTPPGTTWKRLVLRARLAELS